MTSRSSKLTDLPVSNTISSSDLFLIEKVGSNSSVTSTITGNSLLSAIVAGPYANDSVANTNGVGIHQLYYNANGAVFVRLV